MINFDYFYKITNYNIKEFFNKCKEFIDNDYQFIVNYYQGGDLYENSFLKLDNLIKETTIIEPLFNLYNSRLNTIDMWEINDLFSDIMVKLLTIKNTGKWLRSSKLLNYDNSVKIERVLMQNETLERASGNIGYIDPQNDWVDIALSNQINEEDYTVEGGAMFKVSLQNNFNLKIDNLVDSMIGENVLGKDILKKITFEDGDLKVLTGRDALNQSFNIKLNLIKNSIPEFPNYGIDGELIGSNVSSFSYPSIYRDLLSIFRKDGRWKELSIIDIFRENDSIFIKIGSKSILKDSLITNIQI